MVKYFVLVVVLAAVITSSSALKCYSCMSSGEESCKEDETKECDATPEANLSFKPVCMKVVKLIRGSEHVTRSCARDGSLLSPCSAFQSAESCSLCDSNVCNSGKTFSFSSLLMIFSAILISLANTCPIKI